MRNKSEVMKNLAKVRNNKIILQRPADTPDEMGGRKPGWENVATLWAEFRKPRTNTTEVTGTDASELIREIVIPYRTDVQRGWRIAFGTQLFVVEHPPHSFDREVTILVCREVVL